MLVICDTSLLTALLHSGYDELLLRIFGRVIIPPAVLRELSVVHAALPVWLETIAPHSVPESVSRAGLDSGETDAIALALEWQPDALMMD